MKKLFYVLILAVTFTSCVKDSDYDTPQITCENPQFSEEQLTTIQNVVDKWNAANPTGTTSNVVTYDGEADVYLYGYIVSSDKTGNFYKEIFIQDAPENPQFAVKIAVEMTSLFTKYDVGRKIYINLKGLAVNRSHGELVVGENNNGTVDNIRENLAKQIILRDCQATELTPKQITIGEINNSLLGMYVKFDNLQFDKSVIGAPFVNPLDSYDSYRNMISCESGAELVLESSTFASFKDITLPSGMGSVEGILSRDYGDDFYVLRVNDPSAFDFTGPRCDPLFQDGFNAGFVNWTTYSVTGDQVWVIDTKYGNPGNCAKMSGYSGGNKANEDWLISKAIDLSSATSAILTFQSARNYAGNDLKVYYSTNYDGSSNPNNSTFTWTALTPILSTTGFTWTDSGDLDISDAAGQSTFYLAFKYTSTTSASATYEIDNVKIK